VLPVHDRPLGGPSALPQVLAPAGWCLSTGERGNSPTRLPACSDLVLRADWRGDPDELLTADDVDDLLDPDGRPPRMRLRSRT